MKLSELKDDDMILVSYKGSYGEKVMTVGTFKDEYEQEYKYESALEVYSTTVVNAHLDAKRMLENEIEEVYNDNMYEDWDNRILGDIEEKDIEEIQIILDRILARSPEQNKAYQSNKLIEIDTPYIEGGN